MYLLKTQGLQYLSCKVALMYKRVKIHETKLESHTDFNVLGYFWIGMKFDLQN